MGGSMASRKFASSEELFQVVRDLVDRLRRSGFLEAGDQLQEGFGCLNGLTDGWALFWESVRKVQAATRGKLGREEAALLEAVEVAARRAVRRR